MPPASRRLVASSFVHLLGGGALGVAWLLDDVPGAARVTALPAIHAEVMLLGWVFQLAAGVALWILPRSLHGGPTRSPAVGTAVWLLLQTGLGFALAGLAAGWPEALLAGRLLEGAAVVLFAVHAGSRVWRVPGAGARAGGVRRSGEGGSA